MKKNILFLLLLISCFVIKAQNNSIPMLTTIKAKIVGVGSDNIISTENLKKTSDIILEGKEYENYKIVFYNAIVKKNGKPKAFSFTPKNNELDEALKSSTSGMLIFLDGFIIIDKNSKKKYKLESIIQLKVK